MLHESLPKVDTGNRRIAVFISGGGTTLDNLIRCRRRELELGRPAPFEIVAVISSSDQAGGLRFAAAEQIPTHVIRFGASQDSLRRGSAQAFEICRQADVSLVVLGGFLKLLTVPDDFDLRVLNIHPSLIPAFCGHGFYGLRVHQAVLDYGAQVSGCTVHFVDNHFDHGRIVAQKVVPVLADDSAAQLQQRVFAAECEIYPLAIQAYLDGQLHVAGRRVLWR
ncbi:MAG: phosphoribosylglycinamide formyltransferase [Planctomycetaceae bacterium]|nr:phosphoribosylglycinamide formyltransferase [Planctomycetaceae bacterium]